ncbi:MAG: hypothetical protein K8S55_08895 [Phycisphaerae bacterium]|nr:hypothetical protein [Phycisphaerae bacterium]
MLRNRILRRQARRELENTGTAARHRQLCLKVVTQVPSLTAREVEDRIDIKAHKRLPELRAAGLVHNGKTRHCSISNLLTQGTAPA